jgi:hypothetical protein
MLSRRFSKNLFRAVTLQEVVNHVDSSRFTLFDISAMNACRISAAYFAVALCFAADVAAQTSASNVEAPVTLGFATGRTFKSALTEQKNRDIVEPFLRFDGARWHDVGTRLWWPDRPDGAVRDELRRRVQSPPDLPLSVATDLARVPESEWQTWHRIGQPDGQPTRRIKITGSWVSLEQCTPQALLVPEPLARARRAPSALIATRPLNGTNFTRVPMAFDDPWRQFAVTHWRDKEANAVTIILKDWQAAREQRPDSRPVPTVNKQPNTLVDAIAPPLQWWRSVCANLPTAAGLKPDARMCQVVARRRYDQRTDGEYDAEPIEYEALLLGDQRGPTQALRSHIATRSLAERGSSADHPNQPRSILKVAGEDHLLESWPLLEGSSECIQPLRNIADHSTAVCFFSGC